MTAPTLFDAAPLLVPTPDGRGMTLDERFAAFVAANEWVVVALERLALDLHQRGHERIGMKMLVEVVRWNYARATSDPTSTFRLNNSYTSRLARLLVERRPELADAFEMRALRSEAA